MRWLVVAALSVGLAACGGRPAEPQENAAETAPVKTAEAPKEASGGAKPCLFRETSWQGSTEGGRVLVTGIVDIQMAGMKPQLTPRAGAAPGIAAFDLALVPEAGAAVSNQVRYERTGAPRYSAGEIYCGGERIARFDMVNI